MDQKKQQQLQRVDDGDDGGVPADSAHAQQAAAGLCKRHEQQQQYTDDGDVGGVPAASAHAQQAAAAVGLGTKHEQQQASSLNPTAARLLREAIVSQPAAAAESSDILAFARAVDRADSPLE